MSRKILCCAALVMGLLIGVSEAAPAACEGDGCSSKPLNIMQFMREQAASTRVGKPSPSPRVAKPRPHHTVTTATSRRTPHRTIAAPNPHRTIAARKRSAPAPVEADTSFASRPEQDTQPPALRAPFNPFDRSADAAAAETETMAMASAPEVQLVDAEDINDIDRQADGAPVSSNPPPIEDSQRHSEEAAVSWLQRIWSALGSTFTALAAAVHQLVRVIV